MIEKFTALAANSFMKILKSKSIKKLSLKWLLPRRARLAAIIALARHALVELVEKEWHEFENPLPLVPCLAGPNSVLRGVEAEPRIFRILLDLLAGANLDSRSGFVD